MLSAEIADLSEAVLCEERIPPDLRSGLALRLALHAEAARAMEEAAVPERVRAVPAGCVDLRAERARRRGSGGHVA